MTRLCAALALFALLIPTGCKKHGDQPAQKTDLQPSPGTPELAGSEAMKAVPAAPRQAAPPSLDQAVDQDPGGDLDEEATGDDYADEPGDFEPGDPEPLWAEEEQL